MNLYFFVVIDPNFKSLEKGKELAGPILLIFKKMLFFPENFINPF